MERLMMLHRRALFRGFGSLLAMPAIVKADALMRISVPRSTTSLWIVSWGNAATFGELAPHGLQLPVELVLPEEGAFLEDFTKSWVTAKVTRRVSDRRLVP